MMGNNAPKFLWWMVAVHVYLDLEKLIDLNKSLASLRSGDPFFRISSHQSLVDAGAYL